MKYLITGAGGQLGREWVSYLERTGADFEAYDSNQLNITEADQVEKTLSKYQPDVVINCAAYTKVDQAETEPKQAYLVNETGVKNLTLACKAINSKLVHYSTDYVFSGNQTDKKTYPEGYPETAPVDPINVYGKSKLAGENIIKVSGVEFLLIRVSWLCAAFGSNFVNTMLRMGAERGSVSVVDDQFGSPTYTFDVVEKTIHLLSNKMSGIFHVTCRGEINWADFAEEIFNKMNMPVNVDRISSDQFPVKAKRPAFSLLSTRKIEKAGIQLLDWRTGLKKLLEKRIEQT
jgi:dTDP-4-dehydrorhamnose reductase